MILRLTKSLPLEDRLRMIEIQRAVEFSKSAEVKTSADSAPVYNLAGKLFYAADTDYVLLTVPNAFVHGIFAAMVEPGIELPSASDGKPLMAHITVFRPEELKKIGGADKIKERGQQFRYSLGRLKEVKPEGWANVSKCYFVTVHSPELQALRRSYGLTALPNEGKYEFHITVAVVRRGVLSANSTAKV